MLSPVAFCTRIVFPALTIVAANAADIPALVQKAKPAVVEILTYDPQNRLLKTGTGFFISPDGLLLTNYHVVSGRNLLQECEWCDAEPVSIIAKTPAGTVYSTVFCTVETLQERQGDHCREFPEIHRKSLESSFLRIGLGGTRTHNQRLKSTLFPRESACLIHDFTRRTGGV
jgi:hypothetical protein